MRKIALACVVMAICVLLAGGLALAKEIQGTSKNDRLKGTGRGDVNYGFGGNDSINGLGGGDELSGGPDIVSCGLGNDDQVLADEDNVGTECDRLTRK